jgi:hypothetical protein
MQTTTQTSLFSLENNPRIVIQDPPHKSKVPPIAKLAGLPEDKVTTSVDENLTDLLPLIRKPILTKNLNVAELSKITKNFVPIAADNFKDMGFTQVEGPITIPFHRHSGPIFTFITKGSLTINEVSLTKGDWYLVPPGVAYTISSTTGYEAFFGYTWSC